MIFSQLILLHNIRGFRARQKKWEEQERIMNFSVVFLLLTQHYKVQSSSVREKAAGRTREGEVKEKAQYGGEGNRKRIKMK